MNRLIKTIAASVILLFCVCCGYSQLKESSAAVQEGLKSSGQRMMTAFTEKNFKEYIVFVHPGLIKLMGGNDLMIKKLSESVTELEQKGFSFRSVAMGNTDNIIKEGKELQAVISQTIVLQTATGILTSTSHLIGISADEGKSWTFIDAGSKSLTELQKVFPSLSKSLVLPAKMPPVFTKQ